MAGLLYAQGNLEEAELLYRENLTTERRIPGDDQATLPSINNMASLLNKQGKQEEAAPLYREALNSSRRILGDDHPDTPVFRRNWGQCQLELGMRLAELIVKQ